MSTATCGTTRIPATDSLAPRAQIEQRKGFFARLLDAMAESRSIQARREIAKHAHLLATDDH